MQDYYNILGVSKTANENEIKSAYRKVAMQYHPDKNPGDTQAEEKFKQAAEAYSVLSDANKRARYDQFGHAGVNQGAQGGFSHMDLNDIFDHFGDVFSSSGFGDIFGNTRSSGRGTRNRGTDLKITIPLTLEEIHTGIKKTVKVKKVGPCDKCNGSGGAPGEKPDRCPMCQGTGEIRQVQRSILGQIVNVQQCHQCLGKGQIISKPCLNCKGNGKSKKAETVDLDIPAGVSSGNYMTQQGEGGRVINLSSTMGKSGRPNTSAYNAANFAVDGFTQSLAKEVADQGITVNSVCPGLIETSRMDPMGRNDRWSARLSEIPMKRAGTDEEVGELIGFLSSPRAAYITGQSLNVNGGVITER